MSSKKQIRKKRQEKQEARKPGTRLKPPVVFALFLAAVLVLGLAAYFLYDPNEGAPGPPPRPGAVWSEAHGHWH